MTDIPAGYQLSITSWENDADNYNTITISGLTFEDVKFYLHFLSFFRSAYSYKGEGEYFGNRDIDECPEAYYIALSSAYENFPPSSPELLKCIVEYMDNLDWCHDWASDIIGSWNEGSSYRVYDSFEVHYFETSGKDVSQEF